jgi:hypothetical protein
MNRFKFRVTPDDRRVQVQVFAGPPDGTMQLCGSLIFKHEEWRELVLVLTGQDNVAVLIEDTPAS